MDTGEHAKITVEAAPWISADTVRRFHLHIQSHAEGKVRRDTAASARVLTFVFEQMIEEDGQPSWDELRARWNARFPEQKFESRDGLRKAYRRAYRRIAKPIIDRRG